MKRLLFCVPLAVLVGVSSLHAAPAPACEPVARMLEAILKETDAQQYQNPSSGQRE